jgi:hypothetical protein
MFFIGDEVLQDKKTWGQRRQYSERQSRFPSGFDEV